MIKKVVLLFILVSLAFAQIGKYTHFVASGYNRAGYTIAKGFGSWNTNNNRYDNFPYATFGGGSVSDIAPAGKGFLVVGDFTSVNGYTANGIAYFDGTSWCGFPHLDLYTYSKPFPADTRFPRPASATAQPGSATAIYQSGNTYYIFGGLNPNTGRPRFNQIGGSAITGVAGLARLNFDGNANFTLDNSLNYLTQGRGFPSNEFNGNGFPADSAPATTVGRTKLRVINAGNFLSFYVHPNVGSNSHIFRWRQNDGAWLRVTQGTGNAGFNVSGTPTTFVVTAQAIGGCLDFDADVTNNVVFCAGQFDNSLNQTQNVRYVNVACSGNAQTTGITWQIVANWANFNNFNQSGQSISAITVVNQNQLYVATSFNNRDSNDNLFGVNQYFIYSITQGTPSIIGGRFAKADGSAPNIRKLSFYNNKVYAFGDFSLIDYVFDQGNTWPRRYTRKISGAVSYDGTNWRDAYGGFTADSTSVNTLPLVAPVSGTDYVYFAGATAFYNIYSSGGFVAYNKDSKNWENMANQRFILRNGANGNDGGIGAVHFIRKQRDQVTDAIVVAGSFDWYGSQYLASVAFFRTGNQQFEQLGQGVFLDEADSSFSGDQNYPIYKAGVVLDIEEIGNNFYVGGQFSKNINGKCLGNIAVVPYNGGTFDSLASGCNGIVYDLLGDGNTLYVGGDFDSCSGVAGTRRIAAWDTDKKTFKALSTGFADGRVYAMIRWNGKLYVGGSFATAPASYRNSGVTGLYRWDGDRWEPVYAKCQKDCDLGEFTYPFDSFEPLSRSVSQVRSLRRIGGNLYIQGQVGSSGNQQLIQYDGNFFRQYGAATGNAGCIKQGCLASNNSNIIGAGFSRAQGGDNYNNNYQQYSPEKKNWVDTFTGFDGTPTIVASANIVSLTIFSLFLVILMAL